MGMFLMTRSERRGMIAVLAVLAIVVATVAIRRCGSNTDIPADNALVTAERDSLMALPDTSSVIKKKYNRRTGKKVPVADKPVPERSPLDEVL